MTRIDPERFMRTGMDAMLETLDPWTDFLDEADNVRIDLSGRRLLGGVGLNLGRRDGRITVLLPDESASAYRQGVRRGDVLLGVAGRPVDSLSVPDVQEMLRGEPGSVVEVKVEREGVGSLSFTLRREAPVTRNVSFAERLPGSDRDVVLLRLDRFGRGAAAELAQAWTGLSAEGPVAAVVLDLRNNPGGLLGEAIAVSQLFLPKGSLVVSTRGRSPESNRAYHTQMDPMIEGIPVAVLVNAYSASASEIVAGALQDHDRAVVVGTASFGKGLVQVFRDLPYNTMLKLTMARYTTPSGRGIRKDAIELAGATGESLFHTTSGRTVREGFGVEPEVLVPEVEPGPLETALDREAAFFLFAGTLVAERRADLETALAGGGLPRLDDAALDAFRAWIDGRGFEFETPFEQALGEIETGELSSRTRDAWSELRSAARTERDRAWSVERDRIRRRLAEEVADRLLGPTDVVRASLATDVDLGQALPVLRDASRYESLLEPSR